MGHKNINLNAKISLGIGQKIAARVAKCLKCLESWRKLVLKLGPHLRNMY
jgi:hypothetical protein